MMKKLVFVYMLCVSLLLTACSSNDPYGYEPIYDYMPVSNETYAEITENPFIQTGDMPVSTFSTDVDTASYANIRRMLGYGDLPVKDAVRIEEMINYFDYDLDAPVDQDINVITELSKAPWNENHDLFMVALKAKELSFEESNGMNLVFLIDVSGSMSESNKLPLLKEALYLLIENLRPTDRISLVAYAGSARVILDGGDDQDEIKDAIRQLSAGGSTAGASGIELAYQVAQNNFIEGGNNRIILASDGDFNVGMSDVEALEEFISEKKETGVFLSVLGFGTGNLRDDVMESLADHGNGVYFYIDSIKEAEKVFLHQLSATMMTVAKDVKLQIEFNPAHVYAYRLIGYENRVLEYDDFEDDAKDAGDMGSGHVVIAFYEIIRTDSSEEVESLEFDEIEALRYNGENYLDEFSMISIRYKDPEGETSKLIESKTYMTSYTENPSETFVFASSVVEFGLLLRDSEYKHDASYDHVIERAELALGVDEFGYRTEFIELVETASAISLRD